MPQFSGITAPIGPIGTGIFATVAPGIFRPMRRSLIRVCAFVLMTNDLPVTNFWIAVVSGWVKPSGSISPWLNMVFRNWSIALYCGIAPVATQDLELASQYAPWPGDW